MDGTAKNSATTHARRSNTKVIPPRTGDYETKLLESTIEKITGTNNYAVSQLKNIVII